MTTGVARMDIDWGPIGTGGGILAGLLVGVQALARGIGWLLNWNDRRETNKSAELAAREAAVMARETAYAQKVEHRISGLEGQVEDLGARYDALDGKHNRLLLKFSKLRGYALEVTVELKQHNPQSAALARAEEYLRQTYSDYNANSPQNQELDAALKRLDE